MPGAVIDLGADVGEGFAWEGDLLDHVTSASVSCGAHAGDDAAIARTLRGARARQIVCGAHPGYEDRAHFGRRELHVPAEELVGSIRRQVGHLLGLAEAEQVAIRFLKPHGALYNQAQRDEEVARAVVEAALPFGLPIVGLPAGVLGGVARGQGLRFVAEGFADRAYRADGTLVPRTEPGAVLDDPAAVLDQALRLIEQGVETLCLHGDNPRSVALADALRGGLAGRGVAVRSFL